MSALVPVLTALRRGVRATHWYLRELTGESAYERHCERHRRTHPGTEPPNRREFQRLRTRRQEGSAASRCC
ncbi:YbdD/YjiX family protein [Streptomyces yaizuensis]|uniref:YbdD/YjiX family protein n=1 Tax=Streptomyces yaizuensis TaxID=2989713 RepID=A0ABQ5NSH1_9ACTN|nr:YbdD/YjiX family protein [Streptomyces sp. YSPA8]GLF93331.1 YbdD/YjiX family protein [Streptomyces sp. YSPA8]